jgi:hypothetical protein
MTLLVMVFWAMLVCVVMLLPVPIKIDVAMVHVCLLIISPYAKTNFIDHSITDQSSILRFIEDNWSLGRIGDQPFDSKAGSLANMFNFARANHGNKLFLDPSTGLQI